MSLKSAVTILVLASMLSTADFLRCYTCAGSYCTDTPTECPSGVDVCLKTATAIEGVYTKSCGHKSQCDVEIPLIKVKTYCCYTDLCNGAGTVGKNLLLLLVPLASIFVLS
ncbi:lymphocyte antigen 6D-like [Engraulis encrasicolus]|uniref:lymphocyte antigen 6D-like n=1 Tax=Engraulis encrasicolus TaxID=184585 RepID=UPI002FD3023D